MINLIEDFYDSIFLKKIIEDINNLTFKPTHQPKGIQLDHRLQGYPTYETDPLDSNNEIYKFLYKKLKPIVNKPFIIHTFFRKTLLSEVRQSLSWASIQRHQDQECFLAGLIYFNTNSIKDGTYFYRNNTDMEPTFIIGSKVNRCILFNPNIWHAPGLDSWKEVRLTQPFFLKEINEDKIIDIGMSKKAG